MYAGVALGPQNAANLANIRYNLNPEDLKVDKAFVNRGHIQKGIMIHGRGEGDVDVGVDVCVGGVDGRELGSMVGIRLKKAFVWAGRLQPYVMPHGRDERMCVLGGLGWRVMTEKARLASCAAHSGSGSVARPCQLDPNLGLSPDLKKPDPSRHLAGRFGLKLRRYSHVVVHLKELDFEKEVRRLLAQER